MKKGYRFIIKALCLAFVFSPLQGWAEEGPRQTTHATLFGIGRVNHLDTYLSPLEYRGPQATYLHRTGRLLRRNTNILYQTWTQGEFSYAHNPAGNVHDIGGAIHYDMGWGRLWKNLLLPGLDVSVSGLAGGTFGFLYNERNGNNPAQARAQFRLSAALGGDYRFRIRRQTLTLRYQLHLPLLGMAFLPRYGQSYYNLFVQGERNHNLICTHVADAFSPRQLLTLDIPVRRSVLTVGYLSDIRQLQANGLKQHQYVRSFVVGYTRSLSIVRRKNEKQSPRP